MDDTDERLIQLKKINLKNTRINHENPIIFLCGGKADDKKRDPQSIRDEFLRHLKVKNPSLKNNITLAEQFDDWFFDGVYKDLLVFENDIALISSLVIIILESPGSLAELGLFVKNSNLKNKLLVFVSEGHYQAKSFIKLGPLKYLENKNSFGVSAYPWAKNEGKYSAKTNLEYMRKDIEGFIERQPNTECFKKNNEGHVALVIYEITRIFRAVKKKEIKRFLQALGINSKSGTIKRLIFLLVKFKLILEKKKGHNTFYVAATDQQKIIFSGSFDPVSAELISIQQYRTLSKKEAGSVEELRLRVIEECR